jgi:tetratricopeptide (TPR) repeat protein
VEIANLNSRTLLRYQERTLPLNISGEVSLLDAYGQDINSLIEEAGTSEGREHKNALKQLDQKIHLYEKQLALLKPELGATEDYKHEEAGLYAAQARRKLVGMGFLRRTARGSDNFGLTVATGMLAKAQEKGDLKEAIRLLEQGLSIFDRADMRLWKAQLHQGLGQKEEALKECNYIISKFSSDEAYVDARKLKDELETKKGFCFIATACYGSYDHPDVLVFRNWRDSYLATTNLGRTFITTYYRIGPFLASSIMQLPWLASIIRTAILRPLARLLR